MKSSIEVLLVKFPFFEGALYSHFSIEIDESERFDVRDLDFCETRSWFRSVTSFLEIDLVAVMKFLAGG